ncbi:MAG: 3-deoxy-8-phosphooctulonate synthase, partial [Gammaproteobacteria bacterium]|nr:3-deoxy-8-phosphooctulonate synthase [Gammaproteobacteria bacterium]
MQLTHFTTDNDKPFFLIAGPCVIESEELVMDVAGQLKEMTDELKINFIFKSSFDKANRSSHSSFRGPGIEKGLQILEKLKKVIGVPVLTDVHEDTPLHEVSKV